MSKDASCRVNALLDYGSALKQPHRQMIVTLLCQVANRFTIYEPLGISDVRLDMLLLLDIPADKTTTFNAVLFLHKGGKACEFDGN